MVPLEEVFHGATREISLRSLDPATGEESRQQFKVRIPPGVREGQRLRVPKRGHRGPGGTRGDLYLSVRLAPHPDFRVRDKDLFYEVELAPWEAVLGSKVAIPTLQGSVRLTIPPISGERARVARDRRWTAGRPFRRSRYCNTGIRVRGRTRPLGTIGPNLHLQAAQLGRISE